MNTKELTAKAYQLRRDILEMIYRGKAGHFGGSFSVIDILTALYFKHMNVSPENINSPDRDRFILSKGHCAEALYAVLADRGFFPKSDLETFSQFGSQLTGHPNNIVNGVEMNSGSLGHGLSVSVGMALASKMDAVPYHVYVVMGDGELAEGSVWEGAMSAGHYKLDNLVAVIDRNRLQISGGTEDVMAQDCLKKRWESFGWFVIECDGHDMASLDKALTQAKTTIEQPTVIIANTIKGKGFSKAENNAAWHHKVPSEQEYLDCIAELAERQV